jgi:hypothetical protein
VRTSTPRTWRHRWSLWLASVVVLLPISAVAGACAGGDETGTGGTSDTCPVLAFSQNFKDYRTWFSTPASSPNPPISTHTSGTRTAYINKKPPHGSKEFPVGTIIVKELSDPPLKDRQVFAMVKRGCDYNEQGAANWEWFELENVDSSNVQVKWHGVGPPAGEMYAGDPNGGCNGCHTMSAADDFVQTTGFQLSNF